jgi:RES domain-containing protein
VKAWRIERDPYLDLAMTGEGARRVGGRWNSAGRPAVYAASHLSLSILEIVVHARTESQRALKRSKAELDLPDGLVERLSAAAVPKDFSPRTAYAATQALGDRWLESLRTPILVVPSSIVPEEQFVILNPLHPAYPRCRWGKFVSIELDSRLWSA